LRRHLALTSGCNSQPYRLAGFSSELSSLKQFLLEKGRNVWSAILRDDDLAGFAGGPPAQVGVVLGHQLADAIAARERPASAEVVGRQPTERLRQVMPHLSLYRSGYRVRAVCSFRF
jgi:hypothetical protein